ncbi:MAG: transcription termination/antitermination protein NusG [Candidatus Binatia bacterium]
MKEVRERKKEKVLVPIEAERGLRWYTIQTKPRKENSVEKRLGDLGLEVFLPWVRLRRRIGSRYQRILAPLFPGYLFCRLDLFITGKAARYAPGVRDFVKFGNRIAEVGEEIINGILERCPGGVAEIRPRPYHVGEPVLIKEGPLSGLEGIFEREMRGSERVAVLLELLGRQTRLILSSEMIGRL